DRLCRHAIVTKDIEAPVAVVVDQIAGRGVEYDVAAILRDVGSDARPVALATTGRDAHSLERSGSAVEEVDIAESVGVILGQRQCRDKGNVATIAGDRRSAGGVENTDRATDRRDRFGGCAGRERPDADVGGARRAGAVNVYKAVGDEIHTGESSVRRVDELTLDDLDAAV